MKAFKAYDIRGVYGEDFGKDDVYKIGFFLPELLKTNRILVGRDVRISSDEIFEELTRGMTDAGADVYNLGFATTPMVYYFTAKHGFCGSVQITASHNPKAHNGLKISSAEALPVGYDTGLKQLEDWVENREIAVNSPKGKIIAYPVKDEYITFIKEYIDDFSGLNAVVDCSNGMACLLTESILGDKMSYINHTMDGNFPNHDPNPLEAKNILQLQDAVRKQKADVGIIFDGDADRVMFVDENACFISPDLLIAVLGDYFLTDKQTNNRVLVDIRTSKSVEAYLKGKGYEVFMWKVGRANAALKLREIQGIFGGELAGHYYFRDFFYSDSGMLACVLLLNIFADFKQKGVPVSGVINRIVKYVGSGEINFNIKDKEAAVERVKDYFCSKEKPLVVYDFDGYRIEFASWWFNIRPSNTEPCLRFIAESKTEQLLNEKINTVKQLLHQDIIDGKINQE
ncbi:MAG: phosphomannomutase/phosphoglucomutase [Bacteroidales bacterium]|jgi:phosphomannomutase|nr:phosphomannomutase/phosphoglucomutase [Bacteroidales bacterium]